MAQAQGNPVSFPENFCCLHGTGKDIFSKIFSKTNAKEMYGRQKFCSEHFT
jgi:hypothetical protein